MRDSLLRCTKSSQHVTMLLGTILKIKKKKHIDDAGGRVRTASSTSFYVKAMDFVKQWSASLSYEQAEFSGHVTLSCPVNNNQSYRLAVLPQYNLLIHCEQFRYSNIITILNINYLFCHWCSPKPPTKHPTVLRLGLFLVMRWTTSWSPWCLENKGMRTVTFPGHCISVECTAAGHHRGEKCKKKVLQTKCLPGHSEPFPRPIF